MWAEIRFAAYIGLMLGYVLLLLMMIRHRDGSGRAQRVLETIVILAAAWTLSLGLMRQWPFVWYRVAQVGLVILALLTTEFTDIFLQRPPRRWFHWLRIGVVLLLSLIAVGLVTLPLDLPVLELPRIYNRVIRFGVGDYFTWLLVLAWVFSTAAAWGTCIRALRRVIGSKHRNRIRYLLAALLLFAIGDLLVLIGGAIYVPIGLAVRLLGFSVIAFAVLRYDLPDLRRLALSTVQFLLLCSLVLSFYLAVLLAADFASGVFPGLPRLEIVWPAFILALLLAAIVVVSLGPRLHRFFDRIITGRYYDVQRALRTYSEQISLILDLDRLAAVTLDWLQETLRVERSAFILLTPEGEGQVRLNVLRTTADSAVEPCLFGANGRFVTHFRNVGRPLSQYDLDMLSWFQAMPAGERQWLQTLAVDLYVPILVADEPVALLAMGAQVGGRPYSAEDLETLITLAGQTATAVENARLMEDLRAVQGDLHRVGNELAETNRQLQRLDQTKADFIAIASHELRTPLTQIYGYSDILSSMEGDELNDAQVVHGFIGGISRGAARLKQVVEAMVDMSLIETDSLVLNLVPVPLSVVVHNAVETVRSAAERREIGFDVGDLSDLPYIQADGTRLEQVFVGMLSNAVKFTPDGGRVVVSGRLDSSSVREAYVELTVADNGIGIDPDHQDLIFEKFYRSEETLLHSTDAVGFKGAGPGLGLAIARGIVEAHGGRIWVESPGRDEKACPGSTFHVRLPVAGQVKG